MEEPRKPRESRQEEHTPRIVPPVQFKIDFEVESKQTKYLRVELLKEKSSDSEGE